MSLTTSLNRLYKKILLSAHPINSVYISYDETDPNKLFGGVWERLDGVFLYASKSDLGETGGEKEVILTSEQLPKHEHCVYPDLTSTNCYFIPGTGLPNKWGDAHSTPPVEGLSTKGYTSIIVINGYHQYTTSKLPATNEGHEMIADDSSTRVENTRGHTHNNMPPYVNVAMWRRIG